MRYLNNSLLEYIFSQQEEDGKFPTYKVNPIQYPGQKKKLIPDPSPFITANVLFCLISVQDPKFESQLKRAADFILSQMEAGGYWRFWRFRTRQHTFPFDTDDTGICSHVLKLRNIHLDNQKMLAGNSDRNGYFYTWMIPTFKNLFRRPVTTFKISRAYSKALKRVSFFNRNQEHLLDKEPAIAANVILYLGQNQQTLRCIDQIIAEVKENNFPMHYYNDEVSVFYHISRAYSSGVGAFEALKPVICERIHERFSGMGGEQDLTRAMAANVLLDFGCYPDLAGKLVDDLVHCDRYPGGWEAETYFCGKQRVFLSGSPVLTAALLLEAMTKINRNG